MPDTAILVKYWISTDSPGNLPDLAGIEEFRSEISSHYISIVKGRPTGAGGLAQLWVEIVSSISLSHLVQLLLDGVAFDLIKHGTESLLLRPFLTAYKKLRDLNAYRGVDVAELRIEFQDSLLVIHRLSDDSIVKALERVLSCVAENWGSLRLKSGELPFEVHVPVLEDPEQDAPSRFRVVGNMGETIRARGPEDYFRYWGVLYDRARSVRVYDVQRRLLIDESFDTLEQHWEKMERRRRSD